MLTKYISTYLQNRPIFFSLIRPQEAELFEKYDNFIKPLILDLGCGDGFFADTVFDKGKIDVGLDIKNERTEKIENAGIYKKIAYFDGINIPYPDNYFQTVVSNCVLEHVESIEELLREVHRVLKPGGYFLTTVMVDKWEEYLLGRKIFGKKYVLWMRKKQLHKNVFSFKKWHEIFISADFKMEKEIGYLSEKTAKWMDFFHYVAIPEFITYELFGKWVTFPEIFNMLKIGKLIGKLLVYPKNVEDSAANFYILRRGS